MRRLRLWLGLLTGQPACKYAKGRNRHHHRPRCRVYEASGRDDAGGARGRGGSGGRVPLEAAPSAGSARAFEPRETRSLNPGMQMRSHEGACSYYTSTAPPARIRACDLPVRCRVSYNWPPHIHVHPAPCGPLHACAASTVCPHRRTSKKRSKVRTTQHHANGPP